MLDFKYKNMWQNIWKFAIVLCHGAGQKEHIFPIVTILTQKNWASQLTKLKLRKYFLLLKLSQHFEDVGFKLTIWDKLILANKS